MDGGASRLSLLWKSSKFMDDTGEDAPPKTLRLSSKATYDLEKQPSSSLKKTFAVSERVVQAPVETLSKKRFAYYFFYLGSYFNFSYNCYIFFCFFSMTFATNFSDFEEALRKLSPSELNSYHKTYDLKASIIGKLLLSV
jgi:hypothetical protein